MMSAPCLLRFFDCASGTSSSSSQSYIIRIPRLFFLVFFFVLFFTGRLLFSIPRTQLSVFPFRFYFFRVGSHERRENTANGRRRRRHAKKITQSLSRTWAWLLARGPLNPQSRGGAHLPPSRARIIPVGSSPLSVRPLLKFPPLSRAPM